MSSRGDAQLYQVSGLWCSSCARALQHALGRLAGVERATVDFVTHTVELSLASNERFEAVRSLAEGMGYRIEPYRDLAGLRAELSSRTRRELIRLAWVGFFTVWTMALALVEYTEVMGRLTDLEFRWLAIAMGTLSVTGILGGARKVYLIGLSGLIRLRPSIDSLLVVTSLACLGLSFYNLSLGAREVYFDAAILVIAVVLGIRAALAALSGRQLDLLYRSLQKGESELRVVEGDEESWKPVNAVQPGYQVRICAGETIAVDGRVIGGSGAAQSALFTGEADPVSLSQGSAVLAGELLLTGELRVEVGSYYGEREVDRLTKKVISSFHQEPRKGIVDTVLAWGAPALLGLAASSLLWHLGQGLSWEVALPQALSVMIVACPCALFFCRPLPLIRAQMGAERANLILLRPGALARLREVKAIAFDKTGTLTSRAPRIELLRNESDFSEGELWALLAGAELTVQHPIAYAVHNRSAALGLVATEVQERRLLDEGVRFQYAGSSWFFGRAAAASGADLSLCQGDERSWIAHFCVVGESSAEVQDLLASLQSRYHLSLLSGDRVEAVRAAGASLGIEEVAGDLPPDAKAAAVRRLGERQGGVLFCGDGYNDIEAMAAADVAVCMPHAPAAVRLAADVQLLRCDAKAFSHLFRLGRMVERRYRQNLAFALFYNAVSISAAIAGGFAPWVATLAMGSATAAVLVNSMR